MADQFDREDAEAVAACLGDDAAQLREENDEDERADNMDRAASMLTWMLLTHPAFGNLQMTKDAERYRWLRQQDWFDGELCVLRDPKKVLTSGAGLGADCPSRDRLDAAIDAAMSALGVSGPDSQPKPLSGTDT